MYREKTLVVVKPDNEYLIPCIRDILRVHGLQIVREKAVKMTGRDVERLYPDKLEWNFFPELVTYLTSGDSYAWIVGGEDAVVQTLKLKGKTHSPFGIRGLYGKDFIHNVFHCSNSVQDAETEIALLFEEEVFDET